MRRPFPPTDLHDIGLEDMAMRFRPAPDVWGWIEAEVLSEDGNLHNTDHLHLQGADVGVLWAGTCFTTEGGTVVGQPEIVAFRAGGWQKARMERQMVDGCGCVPEVVITLAADYCSSCTDTEFCALVEHELYHVAQEADQYGASKFRRDGSAAVRTRAHDVEEFVGVVRGYGAGRA